MPGLPLQLQEPLLRDLGLIMERFHIAGQRGQKRGEPCREIFEKCLQVLVFQNKRFYFRSCRRRRRSGHAEQKGDLPKNVWRLDFVQHEFRIALAPGYFHQAFSQEKEVSFHLAFVDHDFSRLVCSALDQCT